MCNLYLTRRCLNREISEFWSSKIRPEQYILFNLSSIIVQKQYFIFPNDYQSTLSSDEIIALITDDLEFNRR